MNLPPTAQGSYPIYVRVIVTDDIGNTTTLFKSVEATNEDAGQEFPCSHLRLRSEQKNAENENIFVISPNPVNNELFLTCEHYEDIERIMIYDTKGSILLYNNKHNACSIDVSALNPGLYYIRLQDKHNVSTSKFIKQ